MTGMCPHCGDEVEIRDGLTAYHNWPKPLRQVCPGSKQNARCAASDARPLWNGEPNLRFAGGSMAQAERDEEMPDIELGEPNIWDRIGTMRWQHVVLAVLTVAAFVALCFSPAATCSLRVSSSPTTTTTVPR